MYHKFYGIYLDIFYFAIKRTQSLKETFFHISLSSAMLFCLEARSCLVLKEIFEYENRPLINDVQTLIPKTGVSLKTYCDLTSFGGEWTLILSSDSNSWTKENVLLRNTDNPDLKKDYSILQYPDLFKESYLIADSTFQYLLEANQKGIAHKGSNKCNKC